MPPQGEHDPADLPGSEAGRRPLEERVVADPERLAAGWTRRFVADARRCEEMTRLYREIGFEVVADPVKSEDIADECNDCQLVAVLQFKMLYTRPARDSGPRGTAAQDRGGGGRS